MAAIQWSNGPLNVRRLVLDEELPAVFASTLQGLAEELGLEVAFQKVDPKAGDLWIGAQPIRNWGDDHREVGYVRSTEISLAIYQLRRAQRSEVLF